MYLVEARTEAEYLAAVQLFKEYAAGLGIDLAFQKFDTELATLPLMYGPPVGELWLLQHEHQWVGCCALRRLDDATCELKRMYIKADFRGQKLGELMMDAVLAKAKTLGYSIIKLDSLARLTPALKLYQRYGFQPIAPYNHNPEPDVVYFEKLL
jgi:GNAT superfamily N-acetyltransferase